MKTVSFNGVSVEVLKKVESQSVVLFIELCLANLTLRALVTVRSSVASPFRYSAKSLGFIIIEK